MSPPRSVKLTEEELKAIMKDTVKAGVQEAFQMIGINVADPSAVEQAQRDMAFLRDNRLGMEALRRKGALALGGAVITGIFSLIWMGMKAILPNLPSVPH